MLLYAPSLAQSPAIYILYIFLMLYPIQALRPPTGNSTLSSEVSIILFSRLRNRSISSSDTSTIENNRGSFSFFQCLLPSNLKQLKPHLSSLHSRICSCHWNSRILYFQHSSEQEESLREGENREKERERGDETNTRRREV